MRILFASNFYGEYFFQRHMADELRRHGIESVFVTRPFIPDDPRVIHWRRIWDEADAGLPGSAEVADIERRYAMPMSTIAFSDHLLGAAPPDEAAREAAGYFRMWERFLPRHGIDAFFWFCDGDVMYRSCHYVARKLGLLSYTRVPGPIPNTHAWHDNEFDRWDDYEDRPWEAIPQSEREWAQTYVDGVRNRRISLMLIRRPTANFLSHKVYQFLENIWFKATFERSNPKWRPVTWVGQYVLKVGRERGERRFYREPDLDGKFVFFPLQKPKDIQLSVRAPQYRLAEVVERLADVVSKDTRVLVKGHPTWVGTYPVQMFERLAARGNVDFAPPGYDALKLARHAQAIVTVNNTVGYEGVLLRRPVVTMTPTYYSRFGSIAPSLDLLGATLEEALRRGFPWPEHEIHRFVANLRAASYEGKAHFILNEKNEVLTRRDIAQSLPAYRGAAADHGRSIVSKLERVRGMAAHA